MENDKLVRLSDVIETVENQCSDGNMWGNENLTLIDARKTIDELSDVPTIDAVPVVHGHWERIPNTPTWKCSICGYEITGFIDRDGLTPMDCKVNYCSRCGAKMDVLDTNVGNKDG